MRQFHVLTSLTLAGLFLFSGCYKDDIDDLEKRQDDLEKKFEKLESDTNEQINSLRSLLQAMEGNDYITRIDEIHEEGSLTGYIISFKNSSPITIYNGKNGSNNSNSQYPIIGVKEEGGLYYWTKQIGDEEPEFILCPKGNKICASGSDGSQGEKGDTPVVSLKEEGGKYYWVYTIGGGTEQYVTDAQGNKVEATGPKGEKGDSFFKQVTEYEKYVEFELTGGQKFKLQRYLAVDITYSAPGKMAPSEILPISYTLGEGATNVWALDAPTGWSVDVDEDLKQFTIKAPAQSGLSDKALILVSDATGQEVKVYVLNLQTKNPTDYSIGDTWWQNGTAVGIVVRPKTDSSDGLILHKEERIGNWGKAHSFPGGLNWSHPTVADLKVMYAAFNGSSSTEPDVNARAAFNQKMNDISGTPLTDTPGEDSFYWAKELYSQSATPSACSYIVKFCDGISTRDVGEHYDRNDNQFRCRAVKTF